MWLMSEMQKIGCNSPDCSENPFCTLLLRAKRLQRKAGQNSFKSILAASYI